MMRGAKATVKVILIGKFPNLHRLSVMYTNLEWDSDWRPVVIDETTNSFVEFDRNSPGFLKDIPALNASSPDKFLLSARPKISRAPAKPSG